MPVDPLIDRYRLPQVILPVDPDDIANKAYVDSIPIESIIGNYQATIAELTHTFNFTAVDFDADSEISIMIDGAITAAAALQLRINGEVGTDYFTDGREILAGAETLIDVSAANQGQIMSTAALVGVSEKFSAKIILSLSKGGGTVHAPRALVQGSGGGTMSIASSITLNIDSVSISSVTILATANWNIGTRITVYKKSRT